MEVGAEAGLVRTQARVVVIIGVGDGAAGDHGDEGEYVVGIVNVLVW